MKLNKNQINYRLRNHYLPLSLLSILSGTILFFVWTEKDLITVITDISGYIGISVISISLITGTIFLITKRKSPVSSYFRRDISVFGGILILIHSITGLFVHLRGNMWQYFLTKSDLGYAIRLDDFGLANWTGLLSTFLVLILLVISNDISLKILQAKNWKNIQRFSYLMFVLALIHIIYYRILLDNLNLIYFIDIPLLATVLIFQIIGILLRLKDRKLKQYQSSATRQNT